MSRTPCTLVTCIQIAFPPCEEQILSFCRQRKLPFFADKSEHQYSAASMLSVHPWRAAERPLVRAHSMRVKVSTIGAVIDEASRRGKPMAMVEGGGLDVSGQHLTRSVIQARRGGHGKRTWRPMEGWCGWI